MPTPQIMPLSEINKAIKVNKSKLSYYFKLGLLKPISEFPDSKLFLFDLTDVKKRLTQIETLKSQGLKLTEMKDKLK